MAGPGRRSDPQLIAAMAATVVLRVVAVVGRHVYFYVDSIDYETLDFTGRARRPWVTPLLFWLVRDAHARVLFQAVIGAGAWVVLAAEVGACIQDRTVRRLAVLGILALSLTTSITNWDTTMLSESLALSSTALLIAAFLRFSRKPSAGAVAFVAVASVLWVFTRQTSLLIDWLVVASAAVALIVTVVRRRTVPRTGAVLVGVLFVVAVMATISYGRNDEVRRFNLAMVVGARVVTDAEALHWFRGHGMPLPDTVIPGFPVAPEPLLADPAFASWVDRDGLSTYVQFLVEHPWATLTAPLEDLVTHRTSYADPPTHDETMLSTADAYGSSRPVIPEPLETLLFDPGGTGTVLAGLVAVLVLTGLSWQREGWDRRWLVPLLAVVLQWPALTIVWHTSTAELGRLAL
ncbi:MAG TPA: hypothetical protein VGH94_15460, partial [Acidimicrobiales bacterium]